MPKPNSYTFEAIGTHWSIETVEPLSKTVKHEIDMRIDAFDQTYSRFRSDSLVTKLRIPGNYEFPSDERELIEFYQVLYDVTEGTVTPLIGETLESAGYDASYSLTPKAAVELTPKWDDVMNWTGSRVNVKKSIVLDVGAAGKGYLVDIIAKILGSHNIDDYVIDASGDICVRGKNTQRIGLENPHDPSSVIGIALLQNASLCASASNRRRWGDWHHIIDPRTGKPVRDVIATWVVADSTMVADGLATALFFVPADVLKQWKFEAVRLFSDGHIEQTDNFVGELFI